MVTANFHIPLAAERRAVAGEPQDNLVDLLDLMLIETHAHWNVKGRPFRTVHREPGELVEPWRELSDDVAERVIHAQIADSRPAGPDAVGTRAGTTNGGHRS